MKKLAVLAVGLVTTATLGVTLGLEGTAAAAKVNSGSVWSVETLPSQSCFEVVIFFKIKKVRTFTADDFGDAGSWTGGGKTITMNWTAGLEGSARGALTGTYSKTRKEYTGTLTATSLPTAQPVVLVPGVAPGCSIEF